MSSCAGLSFLWATSWMMEWVKKQELRPELRWSAGVGRARRVAAWLSAFSHRVHAGAAGLPRRYMPTSTTSKCSWSLVMMDPYHSPLGAWKRWLGALSASAGGGGRGVGTVMRLLST